MRQLTQRFFENTEEHKWNKKPAFKKLLETLDTKGDLDRHYIEVDARLKDHKRELEKLQKFQAVRFFMRMGFLPRILCLACSRPKVEKNLFF